MKAQKPVWDVCIQFPPKIRFVVGARRTLLTLFKYEGMRASILRQLNLVITEALNNAIENRKAGSTEPIEMEIRLFPKSIWIAVRGRSEKNGIVKLQQALANAEFHEMEEERGRGLLLMKGIMDEVGVRTVADGRTEMWMTKAF